MHITPTRLRLIKTGNDIAHFSLDKYACKKNQLRAGIEVFLGSF